MVHSAHAISLNQKPASRFLSPVVCNRCSSADAKTVSGDVVSSVVLETSGSTPRQKPPPPGLPKPTSPLTSTNSTPPPPPNPLERLCDAANYNSPSIAGEVSGGLTVVRTLTSVLPFNSGRVNFTSQGSADTGSAFDVSVTPASFRVRGKQSQKVTISITPRTDTPLNKYQFGQAS